MPPSGPRVWFVTGAGSGFGRAITGAALAAGDLVVAGVRKPEAAADLIASAPDRVTTVSIDLTDPESIRAAAAGALDWQGRVDVLVNNAGRGLVGAAEDTSDHVLRQLMELHFFGPVAVTRELLPHMRSRRSGTIVQMSSMGGRMSFAGVSGYSATKFALEGWSEALAAEVAPFGIRVLIVEPGAFRTSFNRPGALEVVAGSSAYEDQIEPVRQNMAEGDGKQPGDPAKAADAVLTAVAAENAPLRLPLGNDAADAIAESLRRSAADLRAWEPTSRGTDFDS